MRDTIAARLNLLSENLQKGGVDLALIMENTNLYYYSGIIVNGTLAIADSGKSIYLVRRGMELIPKDTPVETVQVRSFREFTSILTSKNMRFRRIGIEKDVVPVELYEKLRSIFPGSEFVDISFETRWQRACKSNEEIIFLRESARKLDCTMEDAKELIRVGIREIDVSAEIESRARKRLHQGLSRMRGLNSEVFMGSLISGARAALPAASMKPTVGMGLSPAYMEGASTSRIDKNEPIIADFLGNYMGYITDETRTFVIGKLSKELEDAFEVCLDVMSMVEEEAKPGVSAGEIYDKAMEMVSKTRFKNNFMGFRESQVPFIGHGVGLELNEYPFIAKNQHYVLERGMVFAIEPKMVFPGIGAVGIENTYLVQYNSLERLTRFPKEVVYL